jgi:integrase
MAKCRATQSRSSRCLKSRGAEPRFLTVDEEAKVLYALGQIYGPWARLAMLTGLRQMEQFELKWGDVDLERGLLTLPTTKAGDVQYVYLNEEAKTILQGLTMGNKSVWVFPSENPDTPIDPSNFYERVWMPAVKQAGIEWVTWHDLRHTFASRLAMEGATDREIAAALRHSSTALVKRYAHLSPSHMRVMVEKVSHHGKIARECKPVTNPEGVSQTFTNGTVSRTGIDGSVGERSGVEVGNIIGAPDTN